MSNEPATVREGTFVIGVDLPSWGKDERELARFALADGWVGLDQVKGDRLRLRLYDLSGTVILDESVSCPIRLIDNNGAVISWQWRDTHLQHFRVNAKYVWAASPDVQIEQELRITSASLIPLDHPKRYDYSAESEAARLERAASLRSRVPKPGREPGGRGYAFTSLAGELDQLDDLLSLINQGKLAHIPGLMARVRLLTYNRPLGLLQECAAWQDAPLTVYTGIFREEPLDVDDPTSIDAEWRLTGSPVSTRGSPNPVDLDVWLRLRGLALRGRIYTNLEVIKEIGDTVGAHRDPDITPVISRLTKDRLGVGSPMNHLEYYSLMAGRMVLHLGRELIQREREVPADADPHR